MAGIAPVGGLSAIEFQAAYDGRVMSLQKDAIEQQGQEALKLIQSAGAAGANFDISV